METGKSGHMGKNMEMKATYNFSPTYMLNMGEISENIGRYGKTNRDNMGKYERILNNIRKTRKHRKSGRNGNILGNIRAYRKMREKSEKRNRSGKKGPRTFGEDGGQPPAAPHTHTHTANLDTFLIVLSV